MDTIEQSTQVSKPNSAFVNALQAWVLIDLPTVQRALDKQGLELRGDQKTSLASRRNLAQKTKEFKKLEDSEKLLEYNSLLKSYQNEIDALATREKKAESYFFEFYRAIAEAPDPASLLQLSIRSVSDHLESTKHSEEISALKDELARKADYDLLKQRLISSDQKSAESIASKLKKQEEKYEALIDEKDKNWKSIEQQHLNQLGALKSTIEELKTSNEVAELQLHSHNNQIDQSVRPNYSADMSLLTRDVETWKKRVFELEKRNETLRAELAASQNDSSESNIREEFNSRLSDLESENVLLLASLRQAREKLEVSLREQKENSQTEAVKLKSKFDEIESLKNELRNVSDYDQIKQELQLMRQMEFGDAEEESDKTVDSLLVERHKILTQELVERRAEQDNLTSKIDELSESLAKTIAQLDSAKALNAKLESDIAVLQDTNVSSFNDTASIVSSKTQGTWQSIKQGPSGLGHKLEESSILPIITKQRDRFREKNKTLEEDLRRQQTVLNDLKKKNKMLQSDNEDLYEKARYVASLKSGQGHSDLQPRNSVSSGDANRKPLHPKSNVKNLENPYESSYESKLHPIEQFRQKEQERINSRLSPIERLFIFVTRSILATRATRMLFLIYCVCLHCIVMFTTVHLMSLSAKMIPEIGLSNSTGGETVASGGRVLQDAPIY